MAVVGASINPRTGRPSLPVFGGAVAAVTATTWDPANKNASVTLSNNNLTAMGVNGVRSTTSRSGVSKHAELTLDVIANTVVFGLTNSAYTFGDLRTDANSVLIQSNGQIRVAGSVVDTTSPASAGQTLVVEIINSDAYVQRSGAARMGPYALPTSGPWFLAYSGLASGDQGTLNAGATAFVVAPTSGVTSWG